MRSLPAAATRAALGDLARNRVDDSVEIADYEWLACESCTLGFAQPMTPGTHSFYAWLVQQSFYFPTERWEWPLSLSLIGPPPKRVLEVGCGSGIFLEHLSGKYSDGCTGLDVTPEAVAECRRKGLNAVQGELDSFAAQLKPEEKYDAVVAFHTLEHVSDPLGFVRSAKACLRPGGRLLFSTPYSPMSWESEFFDPLNYPPHHMTQWNKKAYEALAREAGLQITVHLPTADSVRRRTSAMLMRLYPPAERHPPGRAHRAAWLIKKSLRIAHLALQQLLRYRVDGRTAPDVVLAEFRLG